MENSISSSPINDFFSTGPVYNFLLFHSPDFFICGLPVFHRLSFHISQGLWNFFGCEKPWNFMGKIFEDALPTSQREVGGRVLE